MPRLEEVECYLRGLWLLLTGRFEGFGWLDFSERGFWRSWWAIVYCLPPIFLSWAAFRSSYLSTLPAGTKIDANFFGALALVEISSWMVPAAIVLIVAQLTSLRSFALPIITATNWLSVPLQWLSSILSIAVLLAPGGSEFAALLSLALTISFCLVHFLIVSRILGGDRLAAVAIVLALFVSSYYVQYQLLRLFGF